MRSLLAALLFTTGCAPMAVRPAPRIADATISSNGNAVATEQFVARADRSTSVCVGEQHDDAGHHRVQAAIFELLLERGAARGTNVALGMEMFRRHMQPALNAFHAGEIDAKRLAEVTDWDEDWGFDFAMYQPLLETARKHGARIIGLNAPRDLTRAVARRGLDALPEPVRDSLPALDLNDTEHRKFFWAIMGFEDGGHGHGGMNPERFYTAQVIWDETMAESVSSWLADPEPRQMMVVAGNGHCHRSAVPSRVARRHAGEALSVLLRSQPDEIPAHAQSDFVIEVR